MTIHFNLCITRSLRRLFALVDFSTIENAIYISATLFSSFFVSNQRRRSLNSFSKIHKICVHVCPSIRENVITFLPIQRFDIWRKKNFGDVNWTVVYYVACHSYS